MDELMHPFPMCNTCGGTLEFPEKTSDDPNPPGHYCPRCGFTPTPEGPPVQFDRAGSYRAMVGKKKVRTLP